jgi:hypothetical protein
MSFEIARQQVDIPDAGCKLGVQLLTVRLSRTCALRNDEIEIMNKVKALKNEKIWPWEGANVHISRHSPRTSDFMTKF